MPETAQKSDHSSSSIRQSSFGHSPLPYQGLLFSEPAYSETGVWCQLADGIDPGQWAGACRYLGSLTPDQFQQARKTLFPAKTAKKPSLLSHIQTFAPFTSKNPDSLISRLKRVFSFNQAEVDHLPLVSIGPEGLKSC